MAGAGYTDRFRKQISCCEEEVHLDDGPLRNMDGRKMDPEAIFNACGIKDTQVQDVMELLFDGTSEEPKSFRSSTQRGSTRRNTGGGYGDIERASFKRVTGRNTGRNTSSRMSTPCQTPTVAVTRSHDVETDGDSTILREGLSLSDETLFAHDISTTKSRRAGKLPIASKQYQPGSNKDDCSDSASQPSTSASGVDGLGKMPTMSSLSSLPGARDTDCFSQTLVEAILEGSSITFSRCISSPPEAILEDFTFSRCISSPCAPTSPKPSNPCPRSRQMSSQ